MQAQHGVALVRLREQAMFDLVHGGTHQGQRIGPDAARLAGQVQHAQDPSRLSHTGTAAQVRMRLGSK